MGIYEVLCQETGATSYKSISPKGYETAVTFSDNWLAASYNKWGSTVHAHRGKP